MISCVTRELVDDQEQVTVEVVETAPNNFCIVLAVHKSDIPKIIGVKGKNVNALKTIIQSVSAKNKIRTTLIIKE